MILKPNGLENPNVRREALDIIANNGLIVLSSEVGRLPRVAWEEFYSAHMGKFFFDRMMEWLAGASVEVFVVEGPDCVAIIRNQVVKYLRTKYQTTDEKNLIHSSDSVESFEREVAIVTQYCDDIDPEA
jgi:nucleoside-diphosphate kinase